MRSTIQMIGVLLVVGCGSEKKARDVRIEGTTAYINVYNTMEDAKLTAYNPKSKYAKFERILAERIAEAVYDTAKTNPSITQITVTVVAEKDLVKNTYGKQAKADVPMDQKIEVGNLERYVSTRTHGRMPGKRISRTSILSGCSL